MKGMGDGLFDKFPDLCKIADSVLGYSIKTLCLENPDNKLTNTLYTQPALFTVSVMEYLDSINNGEEKPNYVLGHSVGEYAALCAAEVFDFETGLQLVKKRGELMAKANGGKMAAIIGLKFDEVKKLLNENNLKDIDIANYNSKMQIVISGTSDSIINAEKVFMEAEGCRRYIILNVSGAFHSRYMADASKEFRQFINNFEFHEPKITIISNVNARPYNNSELKDILCKQISSTVNWTDSIRYLMGKGVNTVIQKGPGTVVRDLSNRIMKECEPLIINELADTVPDNDYRNNSDKKTNFALGSESFLKDYNVRYPCAIGGMYKAISGVDMIVKCANSGILAFYGTGGIPFEKIRTDLQNIKYQLGCNKPFGVNITANPKKLNSEIDIIRLLINENINIIEASGFLNISKALVLYRLKGLHKDTRGNLICSNKIMAKTSLPDSLEKFMSHPPEKLVKELLAEGMISSDEAALSEYIPMADDITIEADSGGHTDCGSFNTLIPSMIIRRNKFAEKNHYAKNVRIGAAGGIGTPAAAAAAFIMGADYIMTGSINQCTVEADTSDIAKSMLNDMNEKDTEYAPAGDSFEAGSAKLQVLKKGTLFSRRSRKLVDLYLCHDSLNEIDPKIISKLERDIFRKSINEIYEDVKAHYNHDVISRMESDEKFKMACIFRWYFARSTEYALKGIETEKSNYQIQCGQSMGAFNEFLKDTPLYNWKNRNIDKITEYLFEQTKQYINEKISKL